MTFVSPSSRFFLSKSQTADKLLGLVFWVLALEQRSIYHIHYIKKSRACTPGFLTDRLINQSRFSNLSTLRMPEFLVGANSYANLSAIHQSFQCLFCVVCFSRLTLHIIHAFAFLSTSVLHTSWRLALLTAVVLVQRIRIRLSARCSVAVLSIRVSSPEYLICKYAYCRIHRFVLYLACRFLSVVRMRRSFVF